MLLVIICLSTFCRKDKFFFSPECFYLERQGKTGENPARSRHSKYFLPENAKSGTCQSIRAGIFRVKIFRLCDPSFNFLISNVMKKILFCLPQYPRRRKQEFLLFKSKIIRQILFFSLLVLWCGNCDSANRNFESENTREVTDDLGRTSKIPRNVERIVSLAPNLTENIFAVGGENKLVGVTTYCDFPAEAQKIAKIGDTQNPNIETIIALKPQLVFVSTASQIQAFAERLERQNIAVFITNPQDIEGVYRSLYQIGEVLNEKERANLAVEELKKRVAATEARTATATDVKVFVQIAREPLFSIGKSSFMTDLINRAGGVSVTAGVAEAYPKFSKETALAYQPDVLILSESEDNLTPNDVFKDSPAVKNGKVFKIKADLISRPGPRIVEGLEKIARALHPESF